MNTGNHIDTTKSLWVLHGDLMQTMIANTPEELIKHVRSLSLPATIGEPEYYEDWDIYCLQCSVTEDELVIPSQLWIERAYWV